MAVEHDAEEVVGFAFMPVGGRINREQRRYVRIGVGGGDFQPNPPVVGDRHQWVHRVQFAAGVVGVVHPADAEAQFEPQLGIVAQHTGHRRQLDSADLQRQLVAVDHDPLDRDRIALVTEDFGESVDDVIEISAVGSR